MLFMNDEYRGHILGFGVARFGAELTILTTEREFRPSLYAWNSGWYVLVCPD